MRAKQIEKSVLHAVVAVVQWSDNGSVSAGNVVE